ncbi:MAG: aminopeptidase, partial [Wenzhouxiangellaceae bacterium]
MRLFSVGLMTMLMAGCSTLGWYGQAARGQLELLTQREDIENLLAAPDTPPETRRKLELVITARDFAHEELALPDNGSYSHYVDLDREAVLWNVVAAPEFSLEPRTWCYPLVGCLAYRGYFRREGAQRLAERLAAQGFDVRVSPVAAYSTLGRLRDPVTSPMLAWSGHRLAGLIFHELAHQRLFVRGDTTFNESYASAVERAGLERFLEHHPEHHPDPGRPAPGFDDMEAAFNRMLLDFRDRLQALYARDLPEAEMRRAKQACFEQLQQCYR